MFDTVCVCVVLFAPALACVSGHTSTVEGPGTRFPPALRRPGGSLAPRQLTEPQLHDETALVSMDVSMTEQPL